MSSGSTKTAQIGFYQVGTQFTVNVDFVKNNGPDTAVGVVVAVTIPDGITYTSSGLSQGTYDNGTGDWTVGSLIPGQSVSGTFTFSVTDDCEGPYTIEFDVSTSGGCDGCLNNNNLCIVTNGVACCDISGCNNNHIQTIDTATHTVALTDNTILVDALSNTVDFTLPAAASTYDAATLKGQSFTFKVIDFTNGVSIVAPGGEKIVDNSTIAAATDTYNFASVGEKITITSDGSNYFVTA